MSYLTQYQWQTLKREIEFRSLNQPHLQAYLAMRISRLLSFFVLLLPLQAFAEVYDVSTTAELREALASAAEAGDDNTIRLAAGTYSTQDDGEGAFTYLSKVDGSLTLSSETPQQMAILDGAHVNTILEWYLEGSL